MGKKKTSLWYRFFGRRVERQNFFAFLFEDINVDDSVHDEEFKQGDELWLEPHWNFIQEGIEIGSSRHENDVPQGQILVDVADACRFQWSEEFDFYGEWLIFKVFLIQGEGEGWRNQVLVNFGRLYQRKLWGFGGVVS